MMWDTEPWYQRAVVPCNAMAWHGMALAHRVRLVGVQAEWQLGSPTSPSHQLLGAAAHRPQ